MRGGDAPAGGLFDEDGRAQLDLLAAIGAPNPDRPLTVETKDGIKNMTVATAYLRVSSYLKLARGDDRLFASRHIKAGFLRGDRVVTPGASAR
jgi:hypothetical protein